MNMLSSPGPDFALRFSAASGLKTESERLSEFARKDDSVTKRAQNLSPLDVSNYAGAISLMQSKLQLKPCWWYTDVGPHSQLSCQDVCKETTGRPV
jgi:hypothetical protein